MRAQLPFLSLLAVLSNPILASSSAPPEDGLRELASRIAEVTVYGGSASIERHATVPDGDGVFVLRGLPNTLDPASVRVRGSGVEVVRVETRERFQRNVPDVRVAALREAVETLEREAAVLEDDVALAAAMEAHVRRLLEKEEQTHAREVGEGRADAATWDTNFVWLGEKLRTLRAEVREARWTFESKQAELADARLELGRFDSQGGVRLRDVVVDLVDLERAEGTLEIEYLVGNAGWEPLYDLRAGRDLANVEVVYRARIWQRSGEDWEQAAVSLSTAEPRRGTAGPEPRPVWLSLSNPKDARRAPSASAYDREALEALRGLGYSGGREPVTHEDKPAPPRFEAEVVEQGLSAHFRLARRETIESRDEPTTVLIGRALVEVTPEHYCVPALDDAVWLRAVAENTSEWTLLPGRAGVYFGEDYLGHAELAAVQPGEEFTLHLGPDPGLSIERHELANLREASGLFSSTTTVRQGWRIEVENHGAFSNRSDGAVNVIVQESLPRASDDRIDVDLARSTPRPSRSERWTAEREENGVLTWVLPVARGAKATIELTTEIGYPEKLELARR